MYQIVPIYVERCIIEMCSIAAIVYGYQLNMILRINREQY